MSSDARPRPPLVAYVIGSALIWAVISPVVDWVTGNFVALGTSVIQGAVMGLFWGLTMFAFERWLERRRSR